MSLLSSGRGATVFQLTFPAIRYRLESIIISRLDAFLDLSFRTPLAGVRNLLYDQIKDFSVAPLLRNDSFATLLAVLPYNDLAYQYLPPRLRGFMLPLLRQP